MKLLSTEEISLSYRSYRESTQLLAETSIYVPEDEDPWEFYRWDPGWIPVADDVSGGCTLCTIVAPPLASEVGQILRYMPQGDEQGYCWSFLAESFQSLLSRFAHDLEAGRYTFEPAESDPGEGFPPLGAFHLWSEELLFVQPLLPKGVEARCW